MKIRLRQPRASHRQRLLPFQERWQRRQRQLQFLILGFTGIVLAGLLLAWPTGRRFLETLPTQARVARFAALEAIGAEPDRAAVAANWVVRRHRGVEETKRAAQAAYDQAAPAFQHLLDVSGMNPSEALFRWGNYDMTFWLSSRVFEADEMGRSYKLRPSTVSAWLRQLRLAKPNTGQLLVPDRAEVRQAAAAEGSELYLELSQTTNSWGCRGEEVNLDAQSRGIVLGDSYMQGLLLPDDQTPPAYLERELAKRLGGKTVSILNTGVLGYSPEQYYFTLVEFAPRMKPHFVVLAPFANDVGNETDALRGRGDWSEAGYWIDQIMEYCRFREIACLITPIVCNEQLRGRRKILGYPGRLAESSGARSLFYLDPIEAFVNEELRLTGVNRTPGMSPLYNGKLVDGHFSPLGASLWGREVATRLALLLGEQE